MIRTAGNLIDEISLGSIEYGVEHLHTPLLVIMGHQFCGAVQAAIESIEKADKDLGVGGIPALIRKIRPAVLQVRSEIKDNKDLLEKSIQTNVYLIKEDILMRSPTIKALVDSGKLEIVMSEHYIDSGKVEVISH